MSDTPDSEAREDAIITCPVCRTQARERMPVNACQHAYVCTGCGERLTPKPGDCCVFCSYADTVCPPKQTA
ncbi:MAG: GDCCVxC domain-containing (seleno)protein [Solirubrobacteraceae bacterium]